MKYLNKKFIIKGLKAIDWERIFGKKCSHFHPYHKKGQCRCVQDVSTCQGNINKCNYPLGRKSYEQDLEEEKLFKE